MAKQKLSHDDFIKKWWKRKFRTKTQPSWDSAITCDDAVDLLMKYEEYLKREG